MLSLIKQFQEEFKNKYGFTPSVQVSGHRLQPNEAEEITNLLDSAQYDTHKGTEWHRSQKDDITFTMFHGESVDDEF